MVTLLIQVHLNMRRCAIERTEQLKIKIKNNDLSLKWNTVDARKKRTQPPKDNELLDNDVENCMGTKHISFFSCSCHLSASSPHPSHFR
jgi:hypothetical protein